MPKQKRKFPPTPWQMAKPVILSAFTPAFLDRGFPDPGMTMWRRRGDFVDVVQLRSKYGTACDAYFGCHPIPPSAIATQPNESSCIFRTSSHHEFLLPLDLAAMTPFVHRELLPAVLQVVDTWFRQFSSLEAAALCLENRTYEVSLCNKHSPWYEEGLAELHRCIRERPVGRKSGESR